LSQSRNASPERPTPPLKGTAKAEGGEILHWRRYEATSLTPVRSLRAAGGKPLAKS
jgi:hypothetical protein